MRLFSALVLIGLTTLVAAGENKQRQVDQQSAAAGTVAKRGATPVYGPPVVQKTAFKTSGPIGYSNSIPAAAIRNVETVGVTKTITPVVTKTTTYNTHSEPALSIGHVQGYSQSAVGQPKIAPVQFNTQYTTYANPTVGVNGPVTYTGPAVASGYVSAVPVAVGGSYGYAVPASYGAPAGSYGSYSAPAVNYQAAAAPAYGQYAQYGQYSYAIPVYASNLGSKVISTQSYVAPSVTVKQQQPYHHHRH